jgi:outer membrane protein OmpA-like peptidoglycan-associated protein
MWCKKNSVRATGCGNTLSVTSNDGSADRQQNRRAELLVSGDTFDNSVNATTGSLQ